MRPEGNPNGPLKLPWSRGEVAAVAVLCAVAFVLGFQAEFSGDFHWHLSLGDWSLDHGEVYRADTLSHTFEGIEMTPLGWLGDVVLAATFRLGGYPAVYALRGLMLVAVSLSLVSFGRALGIHAAKGAAIASLFLADGASRFFLRPEIFALALFAALIWLLHRVEAEGLGRRAWLVPVVCVAWVNLHGSVPLALVLIALVTGENLLRSLLRRSADDALRWAGLGLVCLPAALISPIGVETFTIAKRYGDGCAQVAEFMPPTMSSLSPIELLVFIATIAATAVALVVAPRRASAWLLLLPAAVGYLASEHRRFIVLAMLSMFPLMMSSFAVVGERLARIRADLAAVAGWALSLVALFLTLSSLQQEQIARDLSFDVDPEAYPEATCAFLRDDPLPGKMINDYAFGGYLTWCLRGQAKVAIDQRTCTLYPGWFYLGYNLRCQSSVDLAALADELDASHAVFAPGISTRALSSDPARWALIHVDDRAHVYVRRDRPETKQLAEESVVAILDPMRFEELLEPGAATRVRQALETQQRRCPDCAATHYARCASAFVEHDRVALDAALGAITEQHRGYFGASESLFRAAVAADAGELDASRQHLEAYRKRVGGEPGVLTKLRESAWRLP